MARLWTTPIHPLISTRRWFNATSRLLTQPAASDDPIGPPPILLLPPPAVLSCTCGRKFNSDEGLRAHQKAKAERGPGGIWLCRAQPATAQKWLWTHVDDKKLIRRIEFAVIQPSDTPVSSTSSSELVCSYNWRRGFARFQFHVPGAAPNWRNRPLPVALPPDRGITFRDQNAARMPSSPFEPLFEATSTMNPSFHFDQVDVVVDRNSLGRLLDFSAGRRRESFRLNLHLIHRTLVIERCEKSALARIPANADNPCWGQAFEGNFTRYAEQWTDSASHHRALRYQFGDLSCVVRFEVDACYSGGKSSKICLATNPIPTENSGILERQQQQAPMRQEWVAEMKTANRKNPPSIGQNLAQLWFGRTPWLIVGHHQQGNFTSVNITNVAAEFPAWEARNQDALRKMAAVLAQLRMAIEENGGQHCVAVCEEDVFPPAISVHPSSFPRNPVSDELRRKLWRTPWRPEEAQTLIKGINNVQSVNPEEATK